MTSAAQLWPSVLVNSEFTILRSLDNSQTFVRLRLQLVCVSFAKLRKGI